MAESHNGALREERGSGFWTGLLMFSFVASFFGVVLKAKAAVMAWESFVMTRFDWPVVSWTFVAGLLLAYSALRTSSVDSKLDEKTTSTIISEILARQIIDPLLVMLLVVILRSFA